MVRERQSKFIIFICGANQEVPVPAWLPACPSVPDFEFRHKIVFTKPMPVGHVVVLFVCQFFLTWSGIPRSFHKILLLWWKTTGLTPYKKSQHVFLPMSFILRKFYDQSRHFSSSIKNKSISLIYFTPSTMKFKKQTFWIY